MVSTSPPSWSSKVFALAAASTMTTGFAIRLSLQILLKSQKAAITTVVAL